MTRLLVTLTLLFASATLGASLALFVGWPVGLLTGGFVFLAMVQAAGAVRHGRERRNIARRLAQLGERNEELGRDLGAARTRMEEITHQADARDAHDRKIVSELQMLEGLMREFAGRVAGQARAHQAAASATGAVPRQVNAAAHAGYFAQGGALLETVRASLEENRVDLYLQPVVSLPQRKLRFYEALSRLRTADGAVIMPEQYIRIAAPAGLMCVVDNLLLFRCVQVVRRLAQKNREVGMFCNISGETLTDAEFFPQFLDYMQANRDLAGQIVFEFAQAAVRKPEAEQNLARLSALGFALSMDHVETLALDFARLQALGFRYLKVRAATLTGGMQGAGAAVAAEDFKTLLARHGLDLIVERVEDEKTVVQLLDYAVDYAQGFLFGEPRAVRDEARAAAAPAEASVVPLRRAG